MVSNLTSVFRSRNQNQNKKASKDKTGTTVVSTSSEDQPQPTPAMVLVPTVTIQEAPKEVEIVVAEQPELIPSGSIIVQEVEILTPNEDEVKPDDPEQKSQDECAMCQKVGNYVRSSYEAGKARFQQLVNRLLDPSLHVTIRSEISYFSGPFSPLFDALCKPEPFLLSEELPKVMCEVVDEIFSTLSEFFRTIGRGFSVFATLFTAIWHGLSENVFYGFHELGENLGENIGHLIHFVVQFFHQIIHLFLSSIATVAGAIAGVFTSLHDYLEPTRAEDVW
ncbi:Protein CBG10091 [Caenorhabditis briggsae]|uniref:Protein CBG10091 n=1 Tax=Caenorhabditis briggsae TaxID=6238 RepID=A8XAD3_CAEBR|nr:Protein CBG10091 [Caenorhabditis briggsae]CAP29601.2 Protein CBG10091 [Caenorhabditis briggsae]